MKAPEAKPEAVRLVIEAATLLYRARLTLKVHGSSASSKIKQLDTMLELAEQYASGKTTP